jgi:hypothetical protein
MQGVHEMGYVYLIGTAGNTALTCSAHPDRRTPEHFVLKPQLAKAHDLVGRIIHGKACITTKGTGQALVTTVYINPAFLAHLVCK